MGLAAAYPPLPAALVQSAKRPAGTCCHCCQLLLHVLLWLLQCAPGKWRPVGSCMQTITAQAGETYQPDALHTQRLILFQCHRRPSSSCCRCCSMFAKSQPVIGLQSPQCCTLQNDMCSLFNLSNCYPYALASAILHHQCCCCCCCSRSHKQSHWKPLC